MVVVGELDDGEEKKELFGEKKKRELDNRGEKEKKKRRRRISCSLAFRVASFFFSFSYVLL